MLKVEGLEGAVSVVVGIGAGAGARVGAGAKVEASEGPHARALRDLGNVIIGSFGFQQFFRIYAMLMVGLKDLKVSESKMTPLAMHKAVISAGKPSLEELDWTI